MLDNLKAAISNSNNWKITGQDEIIYLPTNTAYEYIKLSGIDRKYWLICEDVILFEAELEFSKLMRALMTQKRANLLQKIDSAFGETNG